MAVVIANQLRKDIAGDPLFDGVSFKVERRDRLSLAGLNGSGKTTLLRMLAGELGIDGGELAFSKGTRVALHDQRPPLERGLTLREYVLSGAADLIALEAELTELEAAMAARHDAATLGRYAQAQARLEHAGGYAWRERTAGVVRGLGFAEADLDRLLETFSGGELTRASLARALAGDPDMLLLDEPTNHLDVASIEWLERELQSLDAAVILVAHDRWFLESVTKPCSSSPAAVLYFAGPWHEWRLEKAARAQPAEKTSGGSTRTSPGSNASSSGFDTRSEGEAGPGEAHPYRPAREGAKPSANELENHPRPSHARLRLSEACAERPNRCGGGAPVGFRRRQEAARAHLIRTGARGARGPRRPERGPARRPCSRRCWTAMSLGPERCGWAMGWRPRTSPSTRSSSMSAAACSTAYSGQRGLQRPQAQSLLGRFLFSGWEEHDKPVTALSGGERRRLALALVVASGANFLVLDEPTNHLDLESREALEAALEAFPGTVLLVSHDRALIDAVAERTLAIEDRSLRSYKGGWAE